MFISILLDKKEDLPCLVVSYLFLSEFFILVFGLLVGLGLLLGVVW